MQIQISEQPSKRLAQIADGIAAVLADVRAAVEDWSDMRERCRAVIAELETRPPMLPVAEIAEGLEFLRWLDDDHFTYLGYREIVFQGSDATAVSKDSNARGHGTLREPAGGPLDGLRHPA